jgi:uncharacterized RDD family membrane protein YckC
MKARFEPDSSGAPANPLQPPPAPVSGVDRSSDFSEGRFIVNDENSMRNRAPERESPVMTPGPASSGWAGNSPAASPFNLAGQEAPADGASHDAWRQEVAAKLNRYRSRKRAQTPRYPSLQLKFEDSSWSKAPIHPADPPASRLAVAMQEFAPEPSQPAEEPEIEEAEPPQPAGKILEFPRFFATPQLTFNELADPVLDRPRILDVPEQLPPPPALGGMLIEAQEETVVERRPGFELPLNPPSASRRLAAGVIDAALVIAAFAGFAYIFFRMTGTLPVAKESVVASAALVACFWLAYQYMFIVHSGTTPGLRLTHLRLSRFCGQTVPRRLRRWRVVASALSGLSLGLGYAWCMLDEDQLCWHDRITHTYMAIDSSKPSRSENSRANSQTL